MSNRKITFYSCLSYTEVVFPFYDNFLREKKNFWHNFLRTQHLVTNGKIKFYLFPHVYRDRVYCFFNKTGECYQKSFLKWRTTHLVWDYFDIDIKTLSGANTIHHTYGICYLSTSPWSNESIMYSSSINPGNTNL